LGRPQGTGTNAPPPNPRGILLEAGGIVLTSLSLYYAQVNNASLTAIPMNVIAHNRSEKAVCKHKGASYHFSSSK
jgi:hypothetical protein